jgi:hypothetical protein
MKLYQFLGMSANRPVPAFVLSLTEFLPRRASLVGYYGEKACYSSNKPCSKQL